MANTVQIQDVMTESVMAMTPHQTIQHVRGVMSEKRVSCFPVVGPKNEPLGIVTSSDLLDDALADGAPISSIMTEKVYSVPLYENVAIAARIMRNHHLHHLLVVHEKEVVGIVSSFDLLQLVEDKRFVMKNPSTPSSRHAGRRKKQESRA